MSLDRRRERAVAATLAVREATLERGLPPGVCVAATRVGLDVLRELGISARPLPVRAHVLNAKFEERLREYGEGDPEGWPDDDTLRRWGGEGAYAVWLGYSSDGEPAQGRYEGHLVAAMRNPDLLLDFTLDQAERPKKGIEGLEPLATGPTTRGFLRGEEALSARAGNALVHYVARPGEDSFKRGSDWNLENLDGHAIRGFHEGIVAKALDLARRRL